MNLLLHLHYVQGDQMELIKNNDHKVSKKANAKCPLLVAKMTKKFAKMPIYFIKWLNSGHPDYVASPFLYNVYAIPTVMLNK